MLDLWRVEIASPIFYFAVLDDQYSFCDGLVSLASKWEPKASAYCGETPR